MFTKELQFILRRHECMYQEISFKTTNVKHGGAEGKAIRIHPLEIMNVCTNFYYNPFSKVFSPTLPSIELLPAWLKVQNILYPQCLYERICCFSQFILLFILLYIIIVFGPLIGHLFRLWKPVMGIFHYFID